MSEKGQGMVVRGRLGMHTSPAYAEDVYVGALTGLEIDGHPAGFIVPVNARGVTVLCRSAATRDRDPFTVPLSEPEAIPRWLRWHHLRGWLAKAEFTLGLALALTDAMGLKQNEATVGYLVDLMAEVQTVRSCLTAAERDPEFTPTGYCVPKHSHLAAGGISLFKARQSMSEMRPQGAALPPKLDRMFCSALDALDVLGRLKQGGVLLHMIGLGGDMTGNGVSKPIFAILSVVAEAERKMPDDCADKVVWGSRYPQHDTMSAHDARAEIYQIASVSRRLARSSAPCHSCS